MIVFAALGGHGLACLPDDAVGKHLSSGRLFAVLETGRKESCPGYQTYYATRDSSSPAMGVAVKALTQVRRGD